MLLANTPTPGDELFSGFYPVLHAKPKGQFQGGVANREVSATTQSCQTTRSDAANASSKASGPGHQSEPGLVWSLCLLWHCRKPAGVAESASVRDRLLAQDAL